MAKKKRDGSKAAMVVAYKKENPDAGPQAITDALAKQGMEVTPGHVSNILSQDRKKQGEGTANVKVKRGGRPAKAATSAPTAAAPAPATNGSVNLQQVKAAAAFIRECGGANVAQQALMEAAEILG